MNNTLLRRARTGLGAAAIAGTALLAVGCAAGPSMADQIQPVAAQQSAAATADNSATGAPNPANADKISEITATIINNTDMQLTKVSATHTGTGVHWQQQAPGTLAPHSTTTVTDYAGGNNEIDLTYQDSTGATYTFDVDDAAFDKDSAKGATSNPALGVTTSAGSGYHDHASFTVYVGHSFGYTGSAQQYTVPAGVTTLNVQVTGASGGDPGSDTSGQPSINGAQVTGQLAVTPGEVLTIGVGGQGQDNLGHQDGGWGLPWNGSSFSGGNGVVASLSGGGGGGGASVIIANNQIQAVAGGSGGEGSNDEVDDYGGRGGYQGSLTGENGQYNRNGGGQAGAQNTSTGEASTHASGAEAGGAGGGGYAGGQAGSTSTQGGGGAGSSYDAGLTGGTVTTAGGPSQDGNVTLTAANST